MSEWTEELRDRCREHCACYGEPPCFQIDDEPPCEDCVAGRENPDWNFDSREEN